MSASPLVRTELDGPVLTITLDHPKANAFNDEMVTALQDALKQAGRDSQTRCLVLTGSGRFFSTGRDLNDVRLEVEESFRDHLLRTFNPLILQIRQLEKPVIAAVNGAVAGAALGMALACDLRIASVEARFVVGFLGIGLGPDSGVSLFLPLLVGLGRATEYAFSNKPIGAQQALEWGLVNRLAPDEELGVQAAAWAAELAQGPIHAMGLAKRAFNKAMLGNLEQTLDYEAHLQDIAGRGAEYREGVSAFLEKRPAKYV
ncbi:MAG TPA: enoyl-CoA hydratase-related protein [Anaerolineales bacterium]|nr:enoyl-CoA hydratase-related protein [Anaerolineales bacterium]